MGGGGGGGKKLMPTAEGSGSKLYVHVLSPVAYNYVSFVRLSECL